MEGIIIKEMIEFSSVIKKNDHNIKTEEVIEIKSYITKVFWNDHEGMNIDAAIALCTFFYAETCYWFLHWDASLVTLIFVSGGTTLSVMCGRPIAGSVS